MIVYFLRHANAGQSRTSAALDEKRPLDKEGMEQCGNIGRALAALNVQVEVIVSSPLKRAAQTASLVGNEIGHEGNLQFDAALRPGADFDSFRKLLDLYHQNEALMVVGHNPSLSQFLSLMISGGSSRTAVELKKAAVAKVELNLRKPAVLQWCLTPKLLRAAQAAIGAKLRPKISRK